MTERDNREPQQSPGAETETTTVRTQAAFVNKLYKMLEDTTIQSLISWSERGDLFSVSNPTAFSKSVLPQYFKHNNWQSFVRQLNMYGFHKVNDMIHSNLTSDSQTWEFKHPHFKRGEIEELQNIKRKSTKPAFSSLPSRLPGGATRLPTDNDEDIYGPLYKHILHIEDRLHHVTRSYEILKNETNSLRTILTKQQMTFGEFAVLMGDVFDESTNLGLSETKKATILSKLNELQSTVYIPDHSEHSSSPSAVHNNNNNNQFHQGYRMEDDKRNLNSPCTINTSITTGYNDESSNNSSSSSSNNGNSNRRSSSFVKHPVSPIASRSLEQFLLSQQHHQYQNPSRSARSPDVRQHHDGCTPPPPPHSSTTTSPYQNNNNLNTTTTTTTTNSNNASTSTTTTVTNRRMGFGKESHLLNPEPSMSRDFQENNSIDDKFIKKRRTE